MCRNSREHVELSKDAAAVPVSGGTVPKSGRAVLKTIAADTIPVILSFVRMFTSAVSLHATFVHKRKLKLFPT
jgi:hypothetical protein